MTITNLVVPLLPAPLPRQLGIGWAFSSLDTGQKSQSFVKKLWLTRSTWGGEKN